MAHLQLSSLEPSHAPQIHPLAEELHGQTIRWAQAIGIICTQEHIDRMRGSLIGHFIAQVFPRTTNRTALQLLVDWTSLFCCLDDRLEQIDDIFELTTYLNKLLRVFRDGQQPEMLDPFGNGFHDLRERMLDLKVRNWIPRFSSRLERLFDAFVQEATYRIKRITPDFDHYRAMRQVTVGLETGFMFSELTDGITLPPEALDHPVIRGLERAACNIVGLSNDIFTFEREMARGEVNNTVLVLMRHEQLSNKDALLRAIELHDEVIEEFQHLLEEVPRFDPETDHQVSRHIDVLKAFVWGHGKWAEDTGRYSISACLTLEE